MSATIRWNGVSIRIVKLSQLIFDRRYQRPVNENIREEMKNGKFHLAAVDPIIVSYRGKGKYAVLDGQQRAHWLMDQCEMGHKECRDVPVKIHFGLSIEQESELFRQLNTRKAVNRKQLFKAALTEKEPMALSIQSALDDSGCEVSLEKGRPSNGLTRLNSIRALYIVCERWGREALEEVLDFIKVLSTYHDFKTGTVKTHRDAIKDQFIIGFGMALSHLKNSGKYNRTHILQVLREKYWDYAGDVWRAAVIECRGNRIADAYAVAISKKLINLLSKAT